MALNQDPARADFALEAIDRTTTLIDTGESSRYRFTLFNHAGNVIYATSPQKFSHAVNNVCSALIEQLDRTAKKAGSKRRAFVSAYGVFKFSYSDMYVLNSKNNAEELGVSMFPVCSEGGACVVSRREYYPGTNFQAASFQVIYIKHATTKAACLKGPPEDVPTYNLPKIDQKRTIGGVTFTHGRSAEVGAGSSITSDFYRVFHGNKCYELSLSIAESSFANFDPNTVKEFTQEDQKKVETDLMAILDSFRFLK